MIVLMLVIAAILGCLCWIVLGLGRCARIGDDAMFREMERQLHIKHLEDLNDDKK